MSFEEVIHQHFSWFKGKLDSLEHIRDNEFKILACCFLADSLAKSAYPYKPAKERFISVLANFSGDKNWGRVCLYYMIKDKRYPRLKQEPAIDNYISERLKWVKDKSRIHYCEVDPELSVIETETAAFPSLPLFIELCRQYSYSTVFYNKYRCSLVNESNVLSEFVSESAGGDRPYYASLRERKAEASYKKRLIFPANYCLESLRAVNQNVRDLMIRENLNPYQRYE